MTAHFTNEDPCVCGHPLGAHYVVSHYKGSQLVEYNHKCGGTCPCLHYKRASDGAVPDMDKYYQFDKCKKCGGRMFSTVGHTQDWPQYGRLGYIIMKCDVCGQNHTYDEAGALYVYDGEVYPFSTRASPK